MGEKDGGGYESRGTTPSQTHSMVELNLDPGVWTFFIKRTGYSDSEPQTVTLADADSFELIDFPALNSAQGKIVVRLNTADVRVKALLQNDCLVNLK